MEVEFTPLIHPFIHPPPTMTISIRLLCSSVIIAIKSARKQTHSVPANAKCIFYYSL